MKTQVICVPGSVAPAAQRYAPLKAAVGEEADLHFKELEVYRDAMPPHDYSVETELAGLDRFAQTLGLEKFHLVGYSGGGFVSLAYAGTRPERLLSLALFEPARVPGAPTPEERAFNSHLEEKLGRVDGGDFMAVFVREQLKPGVEPPPPPATPPSPEMRKRPAGIGAMIRAFTDYDFSRELFKAAAFPVYAGYGDLTHEYESIKVAVLARYFANIQVQRFAGIHHFVPPEQIYTPAHVQSIRDLWRRRETQSAAQPALQE